jgi:hypothetical protein
VASIQKRVRNGKTTYSVNYRDPAGHSRRKVFDRARDAERWLHENETSKLNRAWVDPAAGNDRSAGGASGGTPPPRRCARPPGTTTGPCSTTRSFPRSPRRAWLTSMR